MLTLDRTPHTELADIIRAEVGLIATSEGSTPALDALSIARMEAALTSLQEQLREEQRAFRAYKEHVKRCVEEFAEEVRP